MTERRLAEVRDYDGLHRALRQRADELRVSRQDLDEVAGLQSGYAGKLLAPVPIKAIGRATLGPMLGALGLKLLLVEDAEALARIRGRIGARAKAKANAGASMPAHKRKRRRGKTWRGNRGWGQMMRARQLVLSSEGERRKRARTAARARWAKSRRQGRPGGGA